MFTQSFEILLSPLGPENSQKDLMCAYMYIYGQKYVLLLPEICQEEDWRSQPRHSELFTDVAHPRGRHSSVGNCTRGLPFLRTLHGLFSTVLLLPLAVQSGHGPQTCHQWGGKQQDQRRCQALRQCYLPSTEGARTRSGYGDTVFVQVMLHCENCMKFIYWREYKEP